MRVLLGLLEVLGYLVLRVLAWPLTVVLLWRSSRAHQRRRTGLDARLVATAEPGETWRFSFSPPRFPHHGEAPPPLALPLAEVIATQATTYVDHHRGYANSSEDLHLALVRRDGSQVSLYDDASARTLEPDRLPALLAALAARGVPITRRERTVRHVPGPIDAIIGPLWFLIALGLLGWS